MLYQPPSPEDLARLKDELGLSSVQMAKLFGLSGGRHWRKYTGGEPPQPISPLPLFFAAARLELDQKALDRILRRMREIGAVIDLEADGEPQP